ncbi:hypothetical protein LTR27_010851 [Elasticomyces elasticus]|nr:hypothetical protein LTR27_010851 [Elasticomyces elasticus]
MDSDNDDSLIDDLPEEAAFDEDMIPDDGEAANEREAANNLAEYQAQHQGQAHYASRPPVQTADHTLQQQPNVNADHELAIREQGYEYGDEEGSRFNLDFETAFPGGFGGFAGAGGSGAELWGREGREDFEGVNDEDYEGEYEGEYEQEYEEEYEEEYDEESDREDDMEVVPGVELAVGEGVGAEEGPVDTAMQDAGEAQAPPPSRKRRLSIPPQEDAEFDDGDRMPTAAAPPTLDLGLGRGDNVYEEDAPPNKKIKKGKKTDKPKNVRKAYVDAHPDEVWHHIGRGWYHPGPAPVSEPAAPTAPTTVQPRPLHPEGPRPTRTVQLGRLPLRVVETWKAFADTTQEPDPAAAELMAVGDVLVAANNGLLLVVGAATITIGEYLNAFPGHRQKVVAHLARLVTTTLTLDVDTVLDTAEWLHKRVHLDSQAREFVKAREVEGKLFSEIAAAESIGRVATNARYRQLIQRLNNEFDRARRIQRPGAPILLKINEAPPEVLKLLSDEDRKLANLRDRDDKLFKEIATAMEISTEQAASVKYNRVLNRVRKEAEKIGTDRIRSDALALGAAYSSSSPSSRLNDVDRQQILNNNRGLLMTLGEQLMSVEQYLAHYPHDRVEMADFLRAQTSFRLPPGNTGLYRNTLLQEWGRTLALETDGAEGSGSKAPGSKPSGGKAPGSKPSGSKAPGSKPSGAKAPRKPTAATHSSLKATMTKLEHEIFCLKIPQRAQLTWAQIVERINQLDPSGHTEETCFELYDTAMLKFEAWSVAECHRELQRLDQLAMLQRQHITDNLDPQLVGQPDPERFQSREYEHTPEAILRHMAQERNLVSTGTFGEVWLRLVESDAHQGITPTWPRALDVWADEPVVYGYDDYLEMAKRNRTRLDAHFRQHGGARGSETQGYTNPFAPPEEQRLASVMRSAAASKKLRNEVSSVFGPRYRTAIPARMPRTRTGGPRLPSLQLEMHAVSFLDAREGIDPPLPTYASTVEHNLTADQLRHRLREREHRLSKKLIKAMTKDQLIAQLTSENIPTDASSLTLGELQDILSALHPGVYADLRRAAATVTSIATVDKDKVRITETRRLAAPDAVRQNLERTIRRSIYPDQTSAQGYLCGLRSLLQSLRASRRYFDPLADPFFWNVENVMASLFQNWDPQRDYLPGDPGTPTPEFDEFVRDRIEERMGYFRGSAEHDEQYRLMTTFNMSEQVMLYLVLEFLTAKLGLERRFALGIVVAAVGVGRPATAHVLSDAEVDENTAVVWLYHDNAEATLTPEESRLLGQVGGQLFGHFSPFDLFGERVTLVDSWGLPRPGAELQPSIGQRRRWTLLTDAEKRVRVLNASQKVKRLAKKQDKTCSNCKEAEIECQPQKLAGKGKQSEGDAKKCKACFDFELECDLAEEIASPPWRFVPKGLTAEQAELWDRYNPSWEEIERLVTQLLPTMRPTDEEKFALHIHMMRVSGDMPLNYLNTLIARLPGFRMRMLALLNSGQQTPEAQLLGGNNMIVQFAGFPVKRRGILLMPTQLTNNLADPYMIACVNLWDQLRQDAMNNVQLPDPIIVSTSGLAGSQVGIWAFGDRTRGWFKWINDASPALAKSIKLVSIVQPHVHHGFPHSMPAARQGQLTQYQGKWLLSNSMEELVDRNAALM